MEYANSITRQQGMLTFPTTDIEVIVVAKASEIPVMRQRLSQIFQTVGVSEVMRLSQMVVSNDSI